jgi:predicted TIM-barrel fold metal-dependent hydrolase
MNANCPLKEKALRGEPITDCTVIDIHGHFGHEGWFDIPAGTPEDVLAVMDRIGIDVLCVSHLLSLRGDCRQGNDLLADALQRYPGRFIGYAVANPNSPSDILAELDRCYDELGMKGIKTHNEFHQYPADGAGYWFMYEYAREKGLPVLGHNFGDVAMTEKIVRAFPEVNFILAHTGANYHGRTPHPILELAKQYDNLYLDLAGTMVSYGAFEVLVQTVGANKIVYGSDICYQQATHQIGRVLLADIPFEEKRAILGENAARIFRLSVQ